MREKLSRRDFIKGVTAGGATIAVAGLLSACGSSSGGSSETSAAETAAAAAETSAAETAAQTAVEAIYTPGTYTASAEGMESDVTVSVTFDETHITDITIDASGETPDVGGAAVEKLQEQVLKAQSSAIDGVAGATVTSVAVKNAVAECIKEASGGKIIEGGNVAVTDDVSETADSSDWLGSAPEIAESDITDTIETEILVVGAGNSGLMTAAHAASLGGSVYVIEKGASSMNERHWLGALYTKEAIEAGVNPDKNKVIEELARYASHRCDQRLIRLWADNSGEAIDWYAEQVSKYNPNVTLHMEWDVGETDKFSGTYYIPPTMHNFQDDIEENHYSSATSKYGFSSLTSTILDNGGEISYETILVKLERDGDAGRVTGAIAQKADGTYVRINASRGVALCCGGYAMNKEMLGALNPVALTSTVNSTASALDTGDGIKAAMWIGADKDPDPTVMLFDRGVLTPDRTADGSWEGGKYFTMGSQPWLKVNMDGNRFSNESLPYDFILHAAYMEKGHLYNTIFDSSWPEHVKQFHQIGCARIEPSPSGGKLQGTSWEKAYSTVDSLIEAGFLQQADTLEELAEKLGIPADNFVATVERYNELCEAGYDEDFGKEPYRLLPLNNAPYYGIRQGANILCTLDGLRITTNMEVLDTESRVIEGLYAAGDCSGGFFAHNYPEYVVGVAVGRSLTEGYLLGALLAEK